MTMYRHRERYGARPYTDNLTQAGANALADKIRAYWYKQVKFPTIKLEKISVPSAEGGSGLFCIRSDMKNGWPA